MRRDEVITYQNERVFFFLILNNAAFYFGSDDPDTGQTALYFHFPFGSHGNKITKKIFFFNNTGTHMGRREGLPLFCGSVTNHSVQTQQGILTTHLTFHLFIFYWFWDKFVIHSM